ncbi:hypothetical protein [Neolewinella litorea]|uniref:TonB C-terminal domain-containing protein n=1 Tax=Neolewinella litorea TaxID=2562452 RepID=A0A4S4NN41_9BACT|nr:hypothetical protein [Neolewinella litorea]THH39801.1 hypothetical protein E4021_09310 [Neolewinella litorea]
MSTESTHDDELLRRYLSGALTAPEEAELARRAARDEGLREALAGLTQAPEADHRARIDAMVDRVRPKATVRRIGYTRYAVAATLLVLLATAALLLPRYFGQPEEITAMTEALDTETTPPAPQAAPPAPAPRRPSESESAPEQATAPAAREADAPTTYNPAPAARKMSAPPPAAGLTGRVIGDKGEGLAGAEIQTAQNGNEVRTDSAGHFTLADVRLPVELVVGLPGTRKDTLSVREDDAALLIDLEPLSVAADRSANGMIRAAAAAPLVESSDAADYAALRQYLADHRPADVPAGNVNLSFVVTTDGRLTDPQFRGPADPATQEYVRRALVESPPWRVVPEQEAVRVYVTLRFE